MKVHYDTKYTTLGLLAQWLPIWPNSAECAP